MGETGLKPDLKFSSDSELEIALCGFTGFISFRFPS